jgi:hypothetical protein
MALRLSRIGATPCLSRQLPATLSRVTTNSGSGWVVVGGWLSLAVSLLHIGGGFAVSIWRAWPAPSGKV